MYYNCFRDWIIIYLKLLWCICYFLGFFEEVKGRRFFVESVDEMFVRWENMLVDVESVVRDVLIVGCIFLVVV